MDEEQPDMVFLRVVTYWTSYESVPLKIQRKLPWLGKPITDASLKAAATNWLASTRAFHWGRTFAHTVIGGVPALEPSETVDRTSLSVRAILPHEDGTLTTLGDRLHYDPQAHEVESDYFAPWLVKAWQDASVVLSPSRPLSGSSP